MDSSSTAEVQGFMIAQFNDGQGNKGRPKPVEGGAGLDPVGLIPEHYRRLPGDVKSGFGLLFPWLR